MQGVDRLSIAALRKLGVSRNKFRVGEGRIKQSSVCLFVCLFWGGRKGVGVTRIEAFRVDNGRVTRLVRNSRRTQALPLWVDKGRYERKLDS